MADKMTSRQRVLMALNHKVPDRVPIDLGGFQTGIHRKAYESLLRHLGLTEDIVILDPVQQLAKPSEQVLQRFRVDTRYLCAKAPAGFDGASAKHPQRPTLARPDRRVRRRLVHARRSAPLHGYLPSPAGRCHDRRCPPISFPERQRPHPFFRPPRRGPQLQSSGFAVCTGIGGVVYEYGWYLRGLEHWFMDMIENPAFCEAVLDQMLQFWTDYYTGFMAEVGDCVDVVMIGDDLAGQDGPLFHPDFYRRVVKPRQKALVQHIKKLTNAKIWYHTCGGCVEYIPELIDNGVDILNPVQISARGMDPADLKRRFGDKIVFWGGGIDSQHILPFASPQRSATQVRDTSPPSNPMAALSSTMSTTSRPASRRKHRRPLRRRLRLRPL